MLFCRFECSNNQIKRRISLKKEYLFHYTERVHQYHVDHDTNKLVAKKQASCFFSPLSLPSLFCHIPCVSFFLSLLLISQTMMLNITQTNKNSDKCVRILASIEPEPILSCEHHVYAMMPVHYPQVKKMCVKRVKAFWTGNEICLGKDK